MERIPADVPVRERLRVSPEVADALLAGAPAVADQGRFEGHGLPYPENVAVARTAVSEARATATFSG